VKRRDAAAPDRHGSIDGTVPACSIFMGEALIFALARSVLSSRQPAAPPPALTAHLILWRATADEDGYYSFAVAL
jgi:hypothetical protein